MHFEQGHKFFLMSINLLSGSQRISELIHSLPSLHLWLQIQNYWNQVNPQLILDWLGYHLEFSCRQSRMNLLKSPALYHRMKTFSHVILFWYSSSHSCWLRNKLDCCWYSQNQLKSKHRSFCYSPDCLRKTMHRSLLIHSGQRRHFFISLFWDVQLFTFPRLKLLCLWTLLYFQLSCSYSQANCNHEMRFRSWFLQPQKQ